MCIRDSEYCIDEVVAHTLAFVLAATRGIVQHDRALRAGGWAPIATYPGAARPSQRTVAVVGLGRIGARYAELLSGFEVELLYAGPSRKPEAEQRLGARRAKLSELLAEADVISLHAPASPATRHLIDAGALRLVRPEAVLVNTSRGALVDLGAVAAALREGRLGAAGLDVFQGEPAVPGEILEAPRAVLTPHVGSATVHARDAMARAVAENVIAVLEGLEPPNPVR